MIKFDNLNIHSIVREYSNFNQTVITLTDKHIKQWMSNQGIRASKGNVNTCKNDIIEEIKKHYSVESVVFESNGNITIKR